MAEFRTSIDIEAPPEDVFEYLTTNAGMTAWMGQFADLDPTPGGRFAVDIAGHPVRGEYLVVDAATRVVVSWGFAGSDELPAGASTVEFVLTPTASGTRVELLHAGLPDSAVPGHADGWTHFAPRLVIAAAGGDTGPDDWQPSAD
ncbi:SRPBCC family protein [Brevibacterium ihuae]|uniref:SRPBCC family protein n=1 Tax=Brevibacterium ihuae TaxID=1631743 RepID=UPI000C757226|nr:SRPBCC domain-containing protein [Brevibacterium ihuae]